MGESPLRRRKRADLAASWLKMTPAQRLQRGAAMTSAGIKLREAGLAALGRASLARDAAPRTRRK